MKVRMLALLAALTLLALGTAPAAASSAKFDPPKSFYLALGDSLAFGYQQAKFNQNFPTENPTVFNTGYVNDFSALLKAVRPAIQTVNFGCPGESTVSYLTGPCRYQALGFPLHNGYPDSQQAAALSFLHDHPGQVSPVTIDLGSNDVGPCGLDQVCAKAEINVVATNMAAILNAIRAAAPDTEIIVMAYYNPFAVLFPSTDIVAEALNAALAADAAAVNARVADAFTPFNLAATEPATLCALTLFCTPLQDVHASDSGYVVIAQQFWSSSEYGRLTDQ